MDQTENERRNLVQVINAQPGSREALQIEYGQVWDTDQMCEEFQAIGFMAPFVIVRRKSDGKKGSLMFQHCPRYYFAFKLDD